MTTSIGCMPSISDRSKYYPTNAEIEILQTWAADIVQKVKPGSMLLELGSGYDELARPDGSKIVTLEQKPPQNRHLAGST